MAIGEEKYIEDCPKCKGKIHFMDEWITDGFYCSDCDVLVDEHGVEIPRKTTLKWEVRDANRS
jgi:hypothetical protein